MITQQEIKERVGIIPRWAERALVVLHDRQTEQEKDGKHTGELNGVGFNRTDAEILSSFAEQVKAGRRLTERQLAVAYRKLPKYARQLLDEAERKATVVSCPCGGRIIKDGTEYRCHKCGYSASRGKEA